jgi:putative copper export protein/mono/diheme cytochrome c family protein
LSLLGTIGFVGWMLPAAVVQPDRLVRRLTRLWWISGLLAILAGLAWFALQAGVIADADGLSDWLDAAPVVATHTRYGHLLMARLGLLVAATALAGWRPRAALAPPTGRSVIWSNEAPGFSGAASAEVALHRTGTRVPVYAAVALTSTALGLQGCIGHAGATAGLTGDGLVLSEALHLLAAGLWFGALLPLCCSVWALSPAPAALVCERFSPIGLACVLVLAGSGFAQGLQLIGNVPTLMGTRYGHIALLKIALFLLALGLAAVNRLWLTDRMAGGVAAARRHLLLSVSFETMLGMAIVTAAAFMASSPPAAHSTPIWPLSWQFSVITVNEDAEFRQEVVTSLMAIGAAIALQVAALLWRRLRLMALAVLVLVVVLRGPSLGLLTVAAYPTSFQTSPTGFSAASIARGEALFGPNCAACHGPEGEGDGPLAAGLRIKPADLTMSHVLEHSDGEMFWWLTHGIDNPEGGLAMPGFAAALSAESRWALIDYVRAHNVGLATQRNELSDMTIQAPAFAVRCEGIAAFSTSDLRGHIVHVVAGGAPVEAPPQSGITTVTLNLRDAATPAAGACVAADPTAWVAYAVLAGVAPDGLTGAGFLVDPNGWLRAVYPPSAAAGWRQDDLVAAIRGIIAHPVEQPSGGQHEHHH